MAGGGIGDVEVEVEVGRVLATWKDSGRFALGLCLGRTAVQFR
jgi:hypothetical protein